MAQVSPSASRRQSGLLSEPLQRPELGTSGCILGHCAFQWSRIPWEFSVLSVLS